MDFLSVHSVREILTNVAARVSFKKPATRAGAVGVATAMVATGFAALPVSAAPVTDPSGMECKPIHVVYVKGTGSSSSDGSTSINDAHEGKGLYDRIGNEIGFENLSGYSVPYPASLGAFSPLMQAVVGEVSGNVNGGTEAVAYGQSVEIGVSTGREHIAEYEAKCAGVVDTKYIIGGFSQGADVAGDIAAGLSHDPILDANGNVLVGADDIAGVVLFADPGREALSEFDSYSGEPKSVLYTAPPQGVMGRNLETVVGYAPEGNPDYLGLAGGREPDFRGLQGKVLSLCHPQDPACAVPPHGMLRAIADFADQGEAGKILAGTDTYGKIQTFLEDFNAAGGSQKFMSGDVQGGMEAMAQGAAAAQFGLDDIAVLLQAGEQISGVLDVAYQDFEGELTFDQFLTVFALSALPYAAESYTTGDNIANGVQDLWNMAVGTGLVPSDLQDQGQMIVDGIKLASALIPDDVLANMAKELVQLVSDGIAKAVGVDDIMNSPAYNELMNEVAILGGFGFHGSYWDGRHQMPDGTKTGDYANWWAAQAAKGALNGTTVDYPIGANPTPVVEPGIEEVAVPGAPIEEPAPEPTADPTTQPSSDPTEDPVDDPTSFPTKAPEPLPTDLPTNEPTDAPTKNVGPIPTRAPTAQPIVNPTVDPVVDPTTAPVEDSQVGPDSGPSVHELPTGAPNDGHQGDRVDKAEQPDVYPSTTAGVLSWTGAQVLPLIAVASILLLAGLLAIRYSRERTSNN